MDVPDTRFARVGEDRIAYQVFGDGPDLVYLSSVGSDCVDLRWDYPMYAAFLTRLASFSRVIAFDPRGTGASDRHGLAAASVWERWAEDAVVVLDAVGSSEAAVLGCADAGINAMLFAATRPERTHALVLANACARFVSAPDYPWGIPADATDAMVSTIAEVIGSPAWAQMSGYDGDEAYASWLAKTMRLSTSPREYLEYVLSLQQVDVRSILPSINVPTLVVHRQDAFMMQLEQGRDVADRIPGARFEVVPGTASGIWTKPNAQTLDLIEEFLTGVDPRGASDRVLAAVLFTDIVGSTERAASLGDRRWRMLLESHDVITRTVVEEHGATLVKTTGDGALVTFDGPGRAIRCAVALRDALQPLGIAIRAGLHAGEIELRGNDIGGIGVHVAARVMEHAGAGELLVSAAVPLLVAGSGIDFEDRGEQDLKGISEPWHLFAHQG